MDWQEHYIGLMVMKNILLFGSGMVIGAIGLALVIAYYSYHTINVTPAPRHSNAHFEMDLATRSLRWNNPRSLAEALEAVVYFVIWHFSGSKEKSVSRSNNRGRRVFIYTLSAFVLFIILSTWLSIDIVQEYQ